MGKSWNFLFSCNRFEEKVKLRSFLGYCMNILITWMIMQRLLPLRPISTHHFNSLDTCYNWIFGCCHLKAGNSGECWIFSTEVLTKKLKFFIFVLSAPRKMFKIKFLAMTKLLKYFNFFPLVGKSWNSCF